MSFASITISGMLCLVDGNLHIKPEAKDSPIIQVTSYGSVTERLTALLGREVVLAGKVNHLADSKNAFSIKAEEVWISQSWGEPKVAISLVGRFSDKFATFSYIGEKQTPCFKFAVSYPTQHKNDQGKKNYFNWQVTSFGKTAENIQKYFTDGSAIAIPSGQLIWNCKEDKEGLSNKTYLSVTANDFSFVGGKDQ